VDDYAFYLYVENLPEMRMATASLAARMRDTGNIVGARILEDAWEDMRVALLALEADTAAVASEILKDTERSTRVRPDSGGEGGPRLEDWLLAEPLGSTLTGSVGVANETILDKEVPWWTTNEEGSSARIGGRSPALIGMFEPGESEPAEELFRQHPIFEPRGKGEARGSGLIRNPIPARRFIQKSLPDITAYWKAAFEEIRAEFEGKLDEAIAAGERL
jgi:hypothetical protein